MNDYRRTSLLCFITTAALIAGFLVRSGAASGAQTLAIEAEKIYTVSHGIIENGRIIARNGKITAVGRDVPIPGGATVLKTTAVIPGMIDIHTHLGERGNDLNEEIESSATPECRAIDAFDYKSPAIKAALAGGVTTIVFRPGSGNVMGGASVALKLKNASPAEMIIKEPADLKMSLETFLGKDYSGKWVVPGFPRPHSTPESFQAVASRAFLRAREYQLAWESYEREKKAGKVITAPKRDLGLETLVKVLKKEIPIHVHCGGDTLECVKIADEFHLEVTLVHSALAVFSLNHLINRKDIHFNVGPALFPMDRTNPAQFKNAPAILANAGLRVSLSTDAPVFPQQSLRDMAALAVRYGMKEEDALKAVTLRGAEALHLDGKIGSIDVGKDADLLLLNGDPFEFTTSVEKVLIDGKIEYERPARAVPVLPDPAVPAAGNLDLPPEIESASRYAIRGGTILTMAGQPILGGVILVSDGKIEKVGPDIAVPKGVPVIDARRFFVMPGLVSCRSQAGLSYDFNGVRLSGEDFRKHDKPILPDRDVRSMIDSQDLRFVWARQMGVTSALITTGDGDVIGGQGAVLKTRDALRNDTSKRDAVMVFSVGEAAKRRQGAPWPKQMPSTRMGIVAVLRQALTDAREYRYSLAGHAGEAQSRDAALESLIPVIEGRMPVMIHCDRESDVHTALNISAEFGLKTIITGAIDVDRATAEELARRRIPVVLKLKADQSNAATAATLANAGVRVAFAPDNEGFYVYRPDGTVQSSSPAGGLSNDLLEIAARAYREGMPELTALRAITLDAARIIGADDRIGSLEAGKDADILILRGCPLRALSVPELVLIDGKPVYQRKDGAWTTPPN